MSTKYNKLSNLNNQVKAVMAMRRECIELALFNILYISIAFIKLGFEDIFIIDIDWTLIVIVCTMLVAITFFISSLQLIHLQSPRMALETKKVFWLNYLSSLSFLFGIYVPYLLQSFINFEYMSDNDVITELIILGLCLVFLFVHIIITSNYVRNFVKIKNLLEEENY